MAGTEQNKSIIVDSTEAFTEINCTDFLDYLFYREPFSPLKKQGISQFHITVPGRDGFYLYLNSSRYLTYDIPGHTHKKVGQRDFLRRGLLPILEIGIVTLCDLEGKPIGLISPTKIASPLSKAEVAAPIDISEREPNFAKIFKNKASVVEHTESIKGKVGTEIIWRLSRNLPGTQVNLGRLQHPSDVSSSCTIFNSKSLTRFFNHLQCASFTNTQDVLNNIYGIFPVLFFCDAQQFQEPYAVMLRPQ